MDYFCSSRGAFAYNSHFPYGVGLLRELWRKVSRINRSMLMRCNFNVDVCVAYTQQLIFWQDVNLNDHQFWPELMDALYLPFGPEKFKRICKMICA